MKKILSPRQLQARAKFNGMEPLESRHMLSGLSLFVNGGTGDDSVTITLDASGAVLQIWENNESLIGAPTTSMALADIQDIFVATGSGNDRLTIDSSRGLLALAGGIHFDGGAGRDSLLLTQSGGPTRTSDEYSVGPSNGGGVSKISQSEQTQSVYFENLEPVLDFVPASSLTVNGTAANNAINYTQGSVAANGLVTIDNFESIEFSNKAALTINGLAGDDVISLNNPTTPTGLTGDITVTGGDPTASDTLVLNGIAGQLDNLRYQPTAVGAGTVINDGAAQPNVLFAGIEHLTLVVQQADGDGVRADGTIGNDTIEFSHGPTGDRGTFVGTMDTNNATGVGPFTMTPMAFFGIFPLANDADVNFFNPGGTDTFIFNGTASDDTIAFASGEAGGVDIRNTVNGAVVSRLELFNVATILARGGDGDDAFLVSSTFSTTVALRIEGGNPSASDSLVYTGTSNAANILTVNLKAGTIQEAAHPLVTFVGVESVTAVAGASPLAVTGVDGTDAMTVTHAGTAAQTLLDVTAHLSLVGTTNDVLTLNAGAGQDTLEVSGFAGALDNLRYSPTAAGAGTVINDNASKPNLVFSGTELLTLVVQQADGDSVRVDGTAGNDNLEFTHGASADRGTFRGTMDSNNATGAGPFTMTEMSYVGANNLANDIDVNFFNSPGGTDTFTYNGTSADDVITAGGGEAGGLELRNTINGVVVSRLELFNFASVLVRAGDGNDLVNFINGSGNIVEDLGAQTVTGFGPPNLIVGFQGAEHVNLTGIGGGVTLTIRGTSGDDDLSYSPTGATAGTVSRAGQGFVTTFTGISGNFTLDPLGGDDSVTVLGTAASNAITLIGSLTVPTVQVGAFKTVNLTGANTEALGIWAGGGDDTLTVDSSAAPVVVPVTFDGEAGVDTLKLQGGVAISDTYTGGPSLGTGTSTIEFAGGTQSVAFLNLEPVIDLVAGPLVVNANDSNNAISYSVGRNDANTADDATRGRVAIDGQEFINFSNKTTLTINALGGDDVISLNNPNTPTGLTGITVNGGDPTGSDRLIISGTAGADSFTFSPTSLSSGAVNGVGPTVTYSSTENLVLDGAGGDDTFNLSGDDGAVSLVGGQGADRVNFAAAAEAVVFDLDLLSVAQRPTTTAATVTLLDVLEDFTGTSFNDILRVRAVTFARNLNGGPNGTVPPGDTLIFDGQGRIVTTNKTDFNTGTISTAGYADTAFDEFESLTFVNTANGGDFNNAFNTEHIYKVSNKPGNGPASVATGDLNNDGFIDVVVVNTKTKNLSLLINQGDGTFFTPVTIATGGSSPRDIVISNFDGVAGLDLVVTITGSKRIAFFHGNNDGTFSVPTQTSTPGFSPFAIAAANIDGDADLDLVVTSKSNSSVMVLLGNGAGAFTTSAPVKTLGRGPVDIVIADFNLDSNLDVATANSSTKNISFLAGNGSGGLAAAVVFTAGSTPNGLAVADFDTDGNPDLAVSNKDTAFVSVLLGVGGALAPQFQPQLRVGVPQGSRHATGIVVGDFTGDGIVDIGLGNSTSNTFTVLLGTGQAKFTTPFDFGLGRSPRLRNSQGLALADLNNDGLLDVIDASLNYDEIAVLLRNV